MLNKSTAVFIIRGEKTDKIYKLPDIVETFNKVSNSVILSLAAHIVRQYPSLQSPLYAENDFKSTQPVADIEAFWMHPMFEPWCDYLADTTINKGGVTLYNTLYIGIQVNEDYQKYLAETDIKGQIKDKGLSLTQIFGLEQVVFNDRKIGLLSCSGSYLTKDRIGPRINVFAMLVGMFYHNEQWSHYKILNNQIPKSAQIANMDVVIIPGSCLSIIDGNLLVTEFAGELKQAYSINKNLKILAICFGHQLICNMYNAKIIKKHRMGGQQIVKLVPGTLMKYQFLKPLLNMKKQECIMFEHHEDYVTTIPEGFDLLGESQSCQIQSIVSKDGRIYSMQFHPEYSSEFIELFTLRQRNYNQKKAVSFGLYRQYQNLKAHFQSNNKIRESIQLFIQGSDNENFN